MNLSELPVLYVDMDCVLTDFMKDLKYYNEPAIYEPGFYEGLSPLPGALSSIRRLIESGKYNVHILTQPNYNSILSYSEKAAWMLKWIPELATKVTMTQNKGLMRGEYLLDDSIKWEPGFKGEFILFNRDADPREEWNRVLKYLL